VTTFALTLTLGLVGWCLCTVVVGVVVGRVLAAGGRHLDPTDEQELELADVRELR
jgi:hypothetical protein